jgi:hypothetical protein
MTIRLNDMTIIEEEVRRALNDADTLGIVFTAEVAHSRSEGKEYWEKTYIVAWRNERECGTHQANVNSEGRCALFHGHYSVVEGDVLHRMAERANLSPGRI